METVNYTELWLLQQWKYFHKTAANSKLAACSQWTLP